LQEVSNFSSCLEIESKLALFLNKSENRTVLCVIILYVRENIGICMNKKDLGI